MRRFWQTLGGYLTAPARGRASAAPARARPALEALEQRWQPSTLTPNQPIMPPFPTVQVQVPRFVVATPNPMTLVGKTADLGIFRAFQITAMQQEANGSFTFSGTFNGHAVTGFIDAPRFGGPLLVTAGISFTGSWLDSQGLQHRVQYVGTLNMDWNRATTWGTLNLAHENTGAALLVYGPWSNEPPAAVNGTFA
jgi:hypothetical protein